MWLRASSDIAPVIVKVLIFYSIVNAQNISGLSALINLNKPAKRCAGFNIFIRICAIRSVGMPVVRAQKESNVYFHGVSLTIPSEAQNIASPRRRATSERCARERGV